MIITESYRIYFHRYKAGNAKMHIDLILFMLRWCSNLMLDIKNVIGTLLKFYLYTWVMSNIDIAELYIYLSKTFCSSILHCKYTKVYRTGHLPHQIFLYKLWHSRMLCLFVEISFPSVLEFKPSFQNKS